MVDLDGTIDIAVQWKGRKFDALDLAWKNL
jgi:hypothetical protein